MTHNQPNDPTLSGAATRQPTAWQDVQTESQLRRRATSLHWQAIGAAAEADHRADTLAQRRVGHVGDRDHQDSLAQVEALRQHAADLAAQEQAALHDLDSWQATRAARPSEVAAPPAAADHADTANVGQFVIAWDPPAAPAFRQAQDHAAAADAEDADAWGW